MYNNDINAIEAYEHLVSIIENDTDYIDVSIKNMAKRLLEGKFVEKNKLLSHKKYFECIYHFLIDENKKNKNDIQFCKVPDFFNEHDIIPYSALYDMILHFGWKLNEGHFEINNGNFKPIKHEVSTDSIISLSRNIDWNLCRGERFYNLLKETKECLDQF